MMAELLLVLLIFVVLAIDSIVKTFKSSVSVRQMEVVWVNRSEVTDGVEYKDISEHIKSEIIRIYKSRNMSDIRDEIIRLLIWLGKHEDPGEFLDKNSYIQEYIFDRSA